MIDTLLGRASLKERIHELEAELAELEEERDGLREQLDAAEERRADAVSDRQDAQERVNRLEDRVTQLEDTVERLRDEDSEISFRAVEDVGGQRLDRVIDRLESFETDEEGVFTTMVEGHATSTTREAFGERTALVERASPCLAVTDDAGLLSVALRPPVAPEPFERWGERVEIDREWFRPTGRYAVALVRADLFALGEYTGDEQLSTSGFRTDVKGDHSKGGYSQARFERLREEQVRRHLNKCREKIQERSAHRLFLLGDAEAIDRLEEDVDPEATGTVDASGKPRPALENAVREFFTVRMYSL